MWKVVLRQKKHKTSNEEQTPCSLHLVTRKYTEKGLRKTLVSKGSLKSGKLAIEDLTRRWREGDEKVCGLGTERRRVCVCREGSEGSDERASDVIVAGG